MSNSDSTENSVPEQNQNPMPDNCFNPETDPIVGGPQEGIAAMFVVVAIVLALVAGSMGCFRIFKSEYAFFECGGAPMMILLIALSILAAISLFCDAWQTRRIAKLEQMVSKLLAAQTASSPLGKAEPKNDSEASESTNE